MSHTSSSRERLFMFNHSLGGGSIRGMRWVSLALALVMIILPVSSQAALRCYEWHANGYPVIGTAHEVCYEQYINSDGTVVTWDASSDTPEYPISNSGRGYCSQDILSPTAHSYVDHASAIDPLAECQVSVTATAPKLNLQGPSTNSVGDPINPADGNVYTSQTDMQGGLGTPVFQRFYNSTDTGGGDLGPGWRHSFSRSVAPRYSTYVLTPTLGPDAQRSGVFTDEATACTSGFAQIQSKLGNWGSATATFDGNACVLTAGGTQIGMLPLLYSQLPTNTLPSPVLMLRATTVKLSASRALVVRSRRPRAAL
jgi:hypothetical protein